MDRVQTKDEFRTVMLAYQRLKKHKEKVKEKIQAAYIGECKIKNKGNYPKVLKHSV